MTLGAAPVPGRLRGSRGGQQAENKLGGEMGGFTATPEKSGPTVTGGASPFPSVRPHKADLPCPPPAKMLAQMLACCVLPLPFPTQERTCCWGGPWGCCGNPGAPRCRAAGSYCETPTQPSEQTCISEPPQGGPRAQGETGKGSQPTRSSRKRITESSRPSRHSPRLKSDSQVPNPRTRKAPFFLPISRPIEETLNLTVQGEKGCQGPGPQHPRAFSGHKAPVTSWE